MSEQPPDAPQDLHDQTAGEAEPADSPQRRLVQGIRAYEVDPPAPDRVTDATE